MRDFLKKALHGLAPAAGAGLAALAVALSGGPISVGAALKIAAGAFLGYLVKPARPAATAILFLALALGASACTPTVRKCMEAKIIDHAPARAEAALACNGDPACLAQVGAAAAAALVEDDLQCRGQVDAGPE
jgi:hypothetical protein